MKNIKRFSNIKISAGILTLLIVFSVGFYFLGLSKVPTPTTTSKSYQMVKQIEKVEETVLLNVAFQNIQTHEEVNRIFNFKIPASEKKSIIVLNFTVKFGIKEPIRINQKGEHHYQVSIPPYKVIGFELDKEKGYQLYDTKKGLLSASTKDIDPGELATNALSTKEQNKHLKNYTELLNESAEFYYRNLIQSIDSEAIVSFEFSK